MTSVRLRALVLVVLVVGLEASTVAQRTAVPPLATLQLLDIASRGVDVSAGAEETVGDNELQLQKLAQGLEHTVSNAQNSLDTANYVWFGAVVNAVVGILLALPAMQTMPVSGLKSWVLWSSVLCTLVFFLVMSSEVISVHKFAKLMLVWGGNLILRTTEKIDEKIARIRSRVNVDRVLSHDRVSDVVDRSGLGDYIPQHALLGSGASTGKVSVDSVINKLTTVPYEDLGYQNENICDDAWVNSGTATMTSDNRLVYSTEGDVASWSPVARWNLRRADHQKKIPNPSHCHFGVGEANDDEACPGRTLFRDGSGDYCDCLEVLTRLGYDMEPGSLLSCIGTRRDTVIGALKSIFEEDAEQGRARDAAMTAFTGACFTTFDASQATPAGGAQVKTYTELGSAVLDTPYYSNSFATLEVVDSSLTFTLETCMEASATIEFRYAATSNVPIQVSVGGTVYALSDGSSTARQTAANGVVFMRGNMVLTDLPLSSANTEVKITRTNTGAALYIHLMKVCTGGTADGCPTSASSGKYCYRETANEKFTTALTAFQGGAMEEFPSLASAMRACDARQDCGGVNAFSTGTGTQKFVAMQSGTEADTTFTKYQRELGVPKDESGMCA